MAEFENINSPPVLTLEKEIQQAVARAVEPLIGSNGWRTYTGPCQERLVAELAELMNVPHVGLACSGSAALELVLRGCRLNSSDEVLLSAYDYPGNFAAIENCGARPALVDVAPNSWSHSFESLDATWTPACKVLITSHLHGELQDMPALKAWCNKRNVTHIQDACQAIGAHIFDFRVGESHVGTSHLGEALRDSQSQPISQPLGQWADATILSFGGSKTISAGRGGAWCTPSETLAQHTRLAAGVGSGTYALSELQAAIVLAQLPYLDRITKRTRSVFASQLALMRERMPEIYAPWEARIHSTAFYQAGWILPPGTTAESRVLPDVLPGIETGKGFDGFHRRSMRRCRKVGDLANCSDIVARTITQHHRFALQT